jgi:hypothetical protein
MFGIKLTNSVFLIFRFNLVLVTLFCCFCALISDKHRPKDRFGNNIATSSSSVDINFCNTDCKTDPGVATLSIFALNIETSKLYSVQNKYSREIVPLAEGQSLPISVEISPRSDGTFQGRLIFPDPATFNINILLNRSLISGSPFEVTVFPESNDLDASQCTMELEKSAADLNNTFPAGSITGVILYARNKYGVLLDSIDPSKVNVQFRNNPSMSIFTGYVSSGIFQSDSQ